MKTKLFTKHTPDSRGRLKVTVETDMVVLREWFRLIGDLPLAVSERAPQIVQAYKDAVKAFAELDDMS